MIDYENFCKIKKLHEQDGLNAFRIAEELGLDQRTVAKWFIEERYRPRKKPNKVSILDPFKAEIGRMIERHPYTATQIFQHLQEMSFQGSYNTVKRYIRKSGQNAHLPFSSSPLPQENAPRWTGVRLVR